MIQHAMHTFTALALEKRSSLTNHRGSKHDPKSPKEHKDTVGLGQSVQADNLSGNVGREGPVSREETQQGGHDLQSNVRLGDRYEQQHHTC